MSHYTKVTTEFDAANKECLVAAIKEVWPNVTVLENAKVRGYPGMKQPTAEIVVRFANPNSTGQGNYDLGFVKRDGKYEMVADYYGMHYPEVQDKLSGARGSAAIAGILKPAYTTKVVEKQIRKSPILNGYRNTSTKNDYIVRKNAKGKDVRYKRLRFVKGGY